MSGRPLTLLAVVTILTAAPVAAACGGSVGGEDRLTVLAASSLTDVFPTIAERFAATADGAEVEVEFVFAGSSSLAAQVAEGAPADVVATADEVTMARITADVDLASDPEVFARNELVVVVHPDAADRVTALADLADPDLLVAICAPQVPCGALAVELLDAADVTIVPTTSEANVRSVLTKVLLGEVDAGLVYRTDVVGLDETDAVVIAPGNPSPTTRYPVAAITDRRAARAFVDFVLSPAGAEVLGEFGFDVAGP